MQIYRSIAFGLLALTTSVHDAGSLPVAIEQPSGPQADVTTDVVLQLRANARVGVGDELALEIHVRNDSDESVTLVRPIYGSWELARNPRYELEWSDQSGVEIPDPLGFAPGLRCGTLDPVTQGDLVKVMPGAVAALRSGPTARTRHEVLASARPGSYSLRVRYLAQGIEGATPLQLMSNSVDVEITDGDLAMWSCRAEQLAAETNHEYVDVTPTRLLPRANRGFWLVFSDYRHRVVDRERQPGGNIWLQALHGDLSANGEAVRLRGSGDEVGWVSVVAVGDGLLVVATSGPVGDRRVEAFPVVLDGTAPVVGPTNVIQRGPGNPYFTRLVARGDQIALLYEGDEEHGGLQLKMLASSGQPLGPVRRLAEQFTDFELLPDGPGLLAVWLERGATEGGVMQRLGADGRALGEPVHFELDPLYSLAGARFEHDILDLAWSDSSTRGDDPSDMMGLYAQRFDFDSDGGTHGVRSLSPKSRTQAYFGAAAWNGSHGARAYLDGEELKLGLDGTPTLTLSVTATGTIGLEALADGFVVLWNDHRDDDSKACRELDACVSEAYGAVLGPDASVRAGPKRLSKQARAKPFVASPFDWQAHCP